MSNADTPAHPADAGLYHLGLTKREAFAMAAMQGMLAGPQCQALREMESLGDFDETLAKWSVDAADALLKELAKEGGQ